MTTTEKIETITAIIEGLDEAEKMDLWNRYVADENRYDDEIFSMDCFDEIMEGTEPIRLAAMVTFGDFNPHHDWFWLNGYGNLVSSEFPSMEDRSGYDAKEIAKHIVETSDAMYLDEVEEILAA